MSVDQRGRRRSLPAAGVAVLVALALLASNGLVFAAGGTNSAPVASNQEFSTSGEPIEITLHATDADGDDLTFVVLEEPRQGTLSGTAPSFLYTPSASYSGSDSFTWSASDGALDSNTGTVSITGGSAAAEPSVASDTAASVTSTQVNFRSVATVDSGLIPALSITIPKPTPLVTGDVMLLHLAFTGPGSVALPGNPNFIVADPAVTGGWTDVAKTHVGNVVRGYVYRRIVGDFEPASYTVTFPFPVIVSAAIGAWSGVDTGTPVLMTNQATTNVGTSVTVPSVYVVAGGRAVGLFATRGYPVATPAGMTQQWNRFTSQAVWATRSTTAGADDAQARVTPGWSGDRTATSPPTNFLTWIGHLVSLVPVGGL